VSLSSSRRQTEVPLQADESYSVVRGASSFSLSSTRLTLSLAGLLRLRRPQDLRCRHCRALCYRRQHKSARSDGGEELNGSSGSEGRVQDDFSASCTSSFTLFQATKLTQSRSMSVGTTGMRSFRASRLARELWRMRQQRQRIGSSCALISVLPSLLSSPLPSTARRASTKRLLGPPSATNALKTNGILDLAVGKRRERCRSARRRNAVPSPAQVTSASTFTSAIESPPSASRILSSTSPTQTFDYPPKRGLLLTDFEQRG
jgi:hypothetical protein